MEHLTPVRTTVLIAAVVGLVYAGRLYITELHHPTGRYELILGNRDWLSDDLTALERRLYEYGRDEGAF